MKDLDPDCVTTCNGQAGTVEFPAARVPLTPPFTSSSLGRTRGTCSSLLDIDHISVSAGRAAITLALQHSGIGKEHEVLVPAYHCESMVAPVEHIGAKPVFYQIGPDTHVDLADVEKKIGPATGAILATHYFGFPQPLLELKDLCSKHGLILIEDCAHAFFGTTNSHQLGSYGDYAIGSAMKFFPLFDGGLLASTKHDLSSIDLFQPSLAMELKGLTSILEYALEYQRLGLVRIPVKLALMLKEVVWNMTKKASGRHLGKDLTPASSQGGYALEPRWIRARMSRTSRFIMMRSQIDRICDGRRNNYQRIVDALTDTPGIKPLFPNLPDGVVPLVAPMIVNEPQLVFSRLKTAGVPIWRFGEYLYPEVTEAICENSLFLSKHVFQFPCHPELTDNEIHWMLNTIKRHLTHSEMAQ